MSKVVHHVVSSASMFRNGVCLVLKLLSTAHEFSADGFQYCAEIDFSTNILQVVLN